MIVSQATGRILYISDESARFLGRKPGVLEGLDVRDVLGVGLPPGSSGGVDSQLSGWKSKPREWNRIGKDGTWVDRAVVNDRGRRKEIRLTWQAVPMGWTEYWLLTLGEENTNDDIRLFADSTSTIEKALRTSSRSNQIPMSSDGAWKFLSFHRANAVGGGDVLFIEELDQDHILYFIGEVAGHHKGASVVRLMLTTYLRIYGEDYEAKDAVQFPGFLLSKMNHALSQDDRNDSLLTAIAIVLNKDGKCVHFAAAGHHPIHMIRQNGLREEMSTPDIPLGIRPKHRYETYKIDTGPGDRILCYTDGLVTCGNGEGIGDGIKTLVETIGDAKGMSAEGLAIRLKEILSSDGESCGDDATFSVIVCDGE
jgi:hypothetical protein